MARSRESLWLWAGASFVAAGAALGGVAGALAAARPGYRVWSSAPMFGVYAACALALACLWAAVRDWPFPFAADRYARMAREEALAWRAPLAADWVDRVELEVVVSALTAAAGGAVALTTGLVGAGGFGKTMLAERACQDRAVRRRFPGGVCWVTVGRELDGGQLAQRISEVVWNLGGKGHTFASLEEAGRALAAALSARPRMLLVADDVWTSGQLAPFVTAGLAGRLLVTTRRPAVLAGTGARPVEVDAVPGEVARRILARGLPQIPGRLEGDLVQLAGGWPLLLSLINGRLTEDLSRGGDIDAAASDVAKRLRRDGPAALDIKDAESRQLAVAATIDYSLYTLAAPDRDRFCQLGIFAEDAEIPLPLITALWQATASAGTSEADAAALCERLDGLSLVSLAGAGDKKAMVIHDVIRDFARRTLGPEQVTELNGLLLAATAPWVQNDGPTGAWWELGTGDRYLRSHLIWHLIEAERQPEAEALACDLRWAGARLAESGPAAVAADLALAGTPRAARMAAAVIRVAHLLAPAEPADAAVDILHSRLAADPDWGPQVTALRDTARRLRLANRWPPPDLPRPGAHAVLRGHRSVLMGGVYAVCPIAVAGRSLLASGGEDGTVRIWNPATGEQLSVLEGHRLDIPRGVLGGVYAVTAVTVDRRELLASGGGDGTVRIWDPMAGEQLAVLTGHRGLVRAACPVTVDGRELLASGGGEDGTVRVWDPATGKRRAVLRGHGAGVRAVCAVTVAGRELLASGGEDKTVRVWDLVTRQQLAALEGHDEWVNALCPVTVAGRELLASGGGDGTVRLWDLATGEQLAVQGVHPAALTALCRLTVDGRELLASTGSQDGTVRVWDPATGAQLAALEGHHHSGPFTAVFALCTVTVAGRDLLASAGADESVRLWDPGAGEQLAVLGSDEGDGRYGRGLNGVCLVTVGDRELLASAGTDGSVRLWDSASGEELAVLGSGEGGNRYGRELHGVCPVTADGRQLLASAGGDGTVRLWDPAVREQLTVFSGHRGIVRSVCPVTVNGQALLASAGDDGTVRLWNPVTGEQLAVLEDHRTGASGGFNAVCQLIVDGRELLAAAGRDWTVRLWDPATGQERAILEGHRGGVSTVCPVTVDGRQLLTSAGADGTARLWDPAAGEQLAALEGHDRESHFQRGLNGICPVIVDRRELLASVGSDGTVRVWDLAARQPRAMMRVDKPIRACARIGSHGLAVVGEGGLYGFDIVPGDNPG